MVMENEIRLGDILDKLTPSDRVVIYNAAGQVVYRGYAANAVHGALNPQRRIKKARFLHMIFTIMQQEAETRCMAGK